MEKHNHWHQPSFILNLLIALIWLINGMVCKIMGLVPRHELIVSDILGKQHAHFFTLLIGVCELLLAFWIITGRMPRQTALFQIVIILGMNIMEFFLTPDLLLFGRYNLLLAILLSTAIYFNTFVKRKSYRLSE